MDTVPKIVLQNPYRILGVYANSPKRDIVSNKGKATAFLKVNKPVEYPLDLKGILPAPNRTLDLMNEAEAHLAIAKEQIKYAQFWFLQEMSPLDDIAFNHLLTGNMAGAIEIWSKQESISSLQNRLVCYLIESKHELALKTAERLYEKFGTEYIHRVDTTSTLQMNSIELLHQFLDTIGEEVGMQKLLDFELRAESKAYIVSQIIAPLVNKISVEVDKTKKVDHEDPKARLDAARKLVLNTIKPFKRLKSILPATDSQYQMIADKLGLEILQCGIDYFSNSDDDDAPHTAIQMLKYAHSIVVGDLAKQRCDENVKVLQEIIDNQPPQEVISSDKVLKKVIDECVKSPANIGIAINLLNETKQHLQFIKEKLGNSDSYYLRMSTQIVALALHNVVEEVNAAQKVDTIRLMGIEMKVTLDTMTPEQRTQKINLIKSTLQKAWRATSIMDEFDMEAKFKKNYYENRNTLRDMCNAFGIPTYFSKPSTSNSSLTTNPSSQTRTSVIGNKKIYEKSSAGEAFWNHIKSHDSSRWQAALLITILGGIIGFLIYYNNPYIYTVDEKFKCIAWGTGIGAISWFFILVDNDDKHFDARSFGNGGCIGALLLIGIFIFYWIYKIIRIVIDKIKGV